MKKTQTFFILFVTTSLFYSSVNTLQYLHDLRLKTNLGEIRPNRGVIEDDRILNAFVRENRAVLPRALQDLRPKNALLFVNIKYPNNRAIIDVRLNNEYGGSVEVTYNGGGSQAAGGAHQNNGFDYDGRTVINISQLQVDRNLNAIRDNKDETIKQAFMNKNSNIGLPLGLGHALRVRQKTRSQAVLYVPEGSLDYKGELTVFFTVR